MLSAKTLLCFVALTHSANDSNLPKPQEIVTVHNSGKILVHNGTVSNHYTCEQSADPNASKQLSLKCVSWRQTRDCNPNGIRDETLDAACDVWIGTGASGYCECDGGQRARPR